MFAVDVNFCKRSKEDRLQNFWNSLSEYCVLYDFHLAVHINLLVFSRHLGWLIMFTMSERGMVKEQYVHVWFFKDYESKCLYAIVMASNVSVFDLDGLCN